MSRFTADVLSLVILGLIGGGIGLAIGIIKTWWKQRKEKQ